MKSSRFAVNRKEALSALRRLSPIRPRDLVLKCAGGNIILSAETADGSVAVETKVLTRVAGVEDVALLAAVVPFGFFYKIVSALSSTSIDIEVSDRDAGRFDPTLNVTFFAGGKGCSTKTVVGARHYMQPELIEQQPSLHLTKMQARCLRNLIAAPLQSVAIRGDELTYAGLRMQIDGKRIFVLGTDGKQLAVSWASLFMPVPNENAFDALLPRQWGRAILSAFSLNDQVTVNWNAQTVSAENGRTVVRGQYKRPYAHLFDPLKAQSRYFSRTEDALVFPTNAVLMALKSARLFAESRQGIRPVLIETEGQQIRLSAEKHDSGDRFTPAAWFTSTIEPMAMAGAEMEVQAAFDIERLRSGITAFGKTVRLAYAEKTLLALQGDGREGTLFVLMPIEEVIERESSGYRR